MQLKLFLFIAIITPIVIKQKKIKMKYRMTYNNKDMSGCSARGIALRDTKEELQELKVQLKDKIYNVKIEEVKASK